MKNWFTICFAELAAVVFVSENTINLKLNDNICVWASKSYYQTSPTGTVEGGVAKITYGELLFDQTFKADNFRSCGNIYQLFSRENEVQS